LQWIGALVLRHREERSDAAIQGNFLREGSIRAVRSSQS
jgi:hypothetical protein